MQDCDYLVNYDIHWNPVRIIQRFGRIDRIGSRNKKIQLVNYWPDMELDDYIKLKGRVESRMKVTVLTATGNGNPLTNGEEADLEYRCGKHGQTDPVRTVQIDPFKTVETDPVKTEQTDPPLGLDIKVAFGRFLRNRILLA